LPNGQAVEGYLVDTGYTDELKQAVVEYHAPFNPPGDREEKAAEVQQWTEEELRRFLAVKRHKTRMAPLWAGAILAADGPRSIPPAIRNLLGRVDQRLNPNPPQQEA
jgi:hypothetical protein